MPSAQGIRAGKAFVELFADDTKLVRGLRAAEKRLEAFGASVKAIGTKLLGIGTAAVAGLVATTTVFASMGDELAKMSVRTGISVESLSALGYAADQSGADLTVLEGGVRRMQRFLTDASQGSTAATDTLTQLGLSVEQLAGLTPDKQFELLADRLAQIPDPTTKAALAMEIFGRAGTGLLPLMQDGAAGIEALKEQAKELGLIISTEDAQAAEVFGDTLDDLWKVIKSGVFAIGAALAPLLQDLATSAIRIAKTIADWIRENKSLIVTVFKIAAGVAAAGAVLVLLGVVISGVGMLFGIAATLITAVGTALGIVTAVVGAILSPIGLVSAAVAGLGAHLIYMSGAGTRALDWLSSTFQTLKTEAVAAFQGIGDALAAGDLALAAKILWLTLKMEWQKGVAFLQEHWLRFKEYFLSLASDAFYGAVSFLVDAWAGLQVAWVETTSFLADAWTTFTSGLTRGWNTAQNFISKGVLRLMALFDDELDVEAASQILDEDLQRQNDVADRQAAALLNEGERQRQSRLAQIEADRSGAQREIGEMSEADRLARERENASALAATGDALAEARQEWEAALTEAANARRDIDIGSPGSPGVTQQDLLDDLQQRLTSTRNIDFGLSQAQRQAIELQAVGAGLSDPEAETAENTKQMIAELKTQNKTLRDLLAQQKKQPPATRVATIG